jgi:hypothetical protein
VNKMSHFYAKIPDSARNTTPSARGHKSTGITTQAAGWQGCIEVDLWHNEEAGVDEYRVCLTPWQNSPGKRQELAQGVLNATMPQRRHKDFNS